MELYTSVAALESARVFAQVSDASTTNYRVDTCSLTKLDDDVTWQAKAEERIREIRQRNLTVQWVEGWKVHVTLSNFKTSCHICSVVLNDEINPEDIEIQVHFFSSRKTPTHSREIICFCFGFSSSWSNTCFRLDQLLEVTLLAEVMTTAWNTRKPSTKISIGPSSKMTSNGAKWSGTG